MTKPANPTGLKPNGNPIARLLQTYLTTKASAEENLDTVPMRSLPGRETARRIARTALEPARTAYVDALAQRWGAIFLSGPQESQGQFAALASELGPAVVVGARDLYRQLAGAIEGSMRTDRLVEPGQFSHLTAAFERVAKDLGAAHLAPVLKFKNGSVAKTPEALAGYVRQTIVESRGTGIVVAFFRRLIGQKATEIRYQSSVLPVIVTEADGVDLEVLSPLFGGRVVSVEISPEPLGENTVMDGLKALRAIYKK